MKGLSMVVALLVLVFGLASAQEVIKYELSSTAALTIGRAVELSASGQCTYADTGNDVIGFVAATETDGINYWNLIVNAGRITGKMAAGQSCTAGDELTVTGTNGELKVAGAGDRVIAKAMTTAAAGADVEIMIQLDPILGAGGARLWQSAVNSMTDITGTASAKQTLTSISITDCDVEYMKVQFTGTADDRVGSGGAVVNVELYDGASMGTQTLYLIDRNFHQSAAVALTATKDVSPTDDPTFTVYVWESNGMTNGRIKGVLTVIGTPR